MLVQIGHDLQSLNEFDDSSYALRSASILTDAERQYISTRRFPLQTAVGLICAKEAIIKAMSGLTGLPRFGFKDIQVQHASNGRPKAEFSPSIQQSLSQHNARWDISISHSDCYVSAVAVLLITASNV